MAASSASLLWLEKTRSQIQNLQEWKDFTSKLYDAVQQQMTENNINFFNDLSETEKIFVLDKAAKAVKSGTTYSELSARISSSLEENILSYVAQEQRDGVIPRSQSHVVASHIQDGVINILENRPSMKVKLHALLNQPIPDTLRTLAWKLQLANTKARMEYLSHVSLNKARSVLDREIALHCEALLSAEQTFQNLKDIKGFARCMRNVMSYCHKQAKIGLLDEDYLLLVPLTQTVFATSKPSTSVDTLSTLLVEEYITFMDSRPPAMHRNEHPQESGIFQKMSLSLQTLDQRLAETIQKIYANEARNPEDALTLGLQRMLQPIFQVFFVGYLKMNTLLYVWDQYILGLDEPQFNCIPVFSLAFLILVQRHLNDSTKQSDMKAVLKTAGTSLSVQEFQTIINKHFYQDLYSSLNKGGSDQFPVHDPTQATPHWSYLTKAPTYARTRPQDRRQAREEKEILKRQMAEKEQGEEQKRRQQEEEQKRQQEERFNRMLAETRRKYEDKAAFENQLKQEQQRSYEIEKRATEQINELQGEIRRLLQQRRVSFGGNSVESVAAPPPSINSQPPTPIRTTHSRPSTTESQPDNTVKEVNGKTANTVIRNLLQKMMESADTLINGRTLAERDILNSVTRKHLKHYSEDVKNAEIEIFGRELELNELDSMEESQRTAVSEATKRRSEARYMATVRASAQILPQSVAYTV
ncbi:uncharacterized protein LOC122930386 [Bufo gargarizans]|uniref:uncharacterized protein LOC122930386 n=1 Tax=Bufo gargarizans TaxID=30331 RepID=UPI001CF370C9|nr:uncharacterized protein LOC122930386 [Bufo gargarizans]